MSNQYIPIDCNFHELLLDRATRRVNCTLRFLDIAGNVVEKEALIVDVFTRKKEEFTRLSDGSLIRLDKIMSLDTIIAPGFNTNNGASKKACGI